MHCDKKNYVQIKMFGTPTMLYDGQMIMLKRKRARAIVYYLAAQKGPVSRKELIKIMFPQMETSVALKNISSYLHMISSVLPDCIYTIEDYLGVSDTVSVDVREFDACFHGFSMTRENAEKAASLYQGPFLNSFEMEDSFEFDQWAQNNAEYYKNKAISALQLIAGHAYLEGRSQEALDVLSEILHLDPFREDIYQQAMRIHYESGNRPGAIRLYEQLCSLLADQLGIAPMPETVSLYSDMILDKSLRRLATDEYALTDSKRVQEQEPRTESSQIYTQDVQDQYSQLSVNAKKLLSILVSTAGRFDIALFARIMDEKEPAVLYAVDELHKAGLVAVERDNCILFPSEKVRGDLRSCILEQTLQYVNRRLAEALEESDTPLDEQKAMTLLYYYRNANNSKKVLEYTLRVGEMANDREDFHKAIACYEEAGTYLKDRELMELRCDIAQIELLIGDYAKARAIMLENAEAARRARELGLEKAFELEAYIACMHGVSEIICAEPAYPLQEDKNILSMIWIAEKELSQNTDDPKRLYYYIRFLQCKLLYYEAIMKTGEVLGDYEKIIQLCRNTSNIRLKSYTDIACLKLGIYHPDRNEAEKYTKMGIAHASSIGNYRTLPFLLVRSVMLDLSFGRRKAPQYNLSWAESLTDNGKSIYARLIVQKAAAEMDLAIGRNKEAILSLKEIWGKAADMNSSHLQIDVLRSAVRSQYCSEWWPEADGILHAAIRKVGIQSID